MATYRVSSPGCTIHYDLLYPCCRLRQAGDGWVANGDYRNIPTWVCKLPWGSVEVRSFPWLQQRGFESLHPIPTTASTSLIPIGPKDRVAVSGYGISSPGGTMQYDLLYPCCRLRQVGAVWVADAAYRDVPTWVCQLPWGAVEIRSFPWLKHPHWWRQQQDLSQQDTPAIEG
jgi:hypothetical protein